MINHLDKQARQMPQPLLGLREWARILEAALAGGLEMKLLAGPMPSVVEMLDECPGMPVP